MPKQLISVGSLIDDSWDLYRSRFVEMMTVSGWLLVTAILNAVSLAFYPAASKLQLGATLTGGESFGIILFAVNAFIVTPIISFWIYTSLTRMMKPALDGKRPNPSVAMREGRAVFIPTAITSLMVVLMIVFAIVVGYTPAILLALLGRLLSSGAVLIIANLALIVGVFISLFLSIKWIIYYIMAPFVTIIEGKPGKQALVTSRRLIEGRFWDVLARVAVPKLVFIIFGVFAMSILAYLIGILVDASGGLNLDLQLRISSMTQFVIPILIASIINPLLIISDVLLYRSLKS